MLIAKSHRVVVTMYSYTVYKCCISVRSGIGAGQIIAGYSRSADQNGLIAAIYTKRERFGGFTGVLFVTPDWTFGLFMFASFHFYTSLQIYLQTILNSIINITVSFRWVNDELYESAQNNTGGTPVSRVVSKLVTGEETAPTERERSSLFTDSCRVHTADTTLRHSPAAPGPGHCQTFILICM